MKTKAFTRLVIRGGLSLVASFMFTFCTSPKVLKLSPRDGSPGNYMNGQYYMQKEKDSAILELAFVEETANRIVFNLAVTNKSTDPVTIFPEQFFILLSDSSDIRYPQAPKYSLINPEEQIDSINKQIEAQNNSHNKYLFLSGLNDVAGLLVDLADLKKKKSAARIEREEKERERKRAEYEARVAEHKLTLLQLNTEKQKWVSHAFRKNILHKDKRVTGSLDFPFQRRYKYLTLIVLYKDNPVKFDFRVNEVQFAGPVK